MKTLDEDFPPLTVMAPELEKAARLGANHFVELASIDCSAQIEKKNGLSYLSWAWAVDRLLRADPHASWTYGEPVRFGDTMMVSCTVVAFGKPMTSHLPVMDHRNKAIPNPDAFAVNTAMQRCLVKAIALHGLGLYIYAGEDLPYDEKADELTEFAESKASQVRSLFAKHDIEGAASILNMLGTNGEYDGEAKELVWGRLESNIRSAIKAYDAISQAKTLESLRKAWEAAPLHSKHLLESAKDKRKGELSTTEKEAA